MTRKSCAVGMRNAILRNYLKSRALSHEPSSDCVIARAKGRVRAQASYGNITVLSHLKSFVFSDLSHCTNTLPVLKSSFLSVLFVLCLELQAVLKAAERQI